MADSPKVVIRRAAKLLRERAQHAINDGWTEPTNVEREKETDPIVLGAGRDNYNPGDPGGWTSAKYVGDIEEDSFAVLIVTMRPQTGLALADLLAAVAGEMDDYGSVIETAEGVKLAPSHGFRYDVAPLWTTALRLARVVLGEASDG